MIDSLEKGSRIKRVLPKRDAYPMIVEFQNSQDISAIEECHLMRVAGTPGQTALLRSRNIVYAGNECEHNFVGNYVLARNKRSGDVRLIEVGRVAVKADLPEAEPKPPSPTDAEPLPTKQKFGSKGQKRALDQKIKSKIDVEATKQQTETTIMNIQLDESDAVTQDSGITKYAPPIHRDALSPQDVYVLEEILSPELLGVLHSNSETILGGDEDEFPINEYTKTMIKKLRASKNESKMKQCCALLYADCLISYLTDPHKKIRQPEYLACEYADLINDTILSEFSMPTSTGRTRPQSMVDKVICFVIVLLLLANNYLIPDIEVLIETLKKPKTKIIQMIRVVGARLTSRGGLTGIVLKLPLAVPPVVKVKQDRKRRL